MDGERDEEALRAYVERMARVLSDWGFPRMAARILMLMMVQEEQELTAAQIAAGLGVSPAAVSTSVRYLQQLGMLIREPVPGSRRDVYRLPDDPWYSVSMTKGGLFSSLSKMSREGLGAAGGEKTVAGARIKEIADFYEYLHDEVTGLLERWREVRSPR